MGDLCIDEQAASQLQAYAGILETNGVQYGLIGPREVPRLWERHLLNCAVVAEPELGLIPHAVSVADVGSGAGLPGLVWAIIRPDVHLTLIEPLLRRATFLSDTVAELGLDTQVTVVRGRAEDIIRAGAHGFDVVTARAVAALEKLLPWTAPLVRPGGKLVLLKGASADTEIVAATAIAKSLGVLDLHLVTCGQQTLEVPTTVVTAVVGAAQ